MDLTLNLIESITNNFLGDQKVGSGVLGDVYKAVYDGKEIAVKRLHPLKGLDDKEFYMEILNLEKVSHNNVVRLIGYCYESRHKCVKHNGETIWARLVERVLCFEYVQGESLENHIGDDSCDLQWQTCYNIIKGTCVGLNHLHSAHKNPIFHLYLNPTNILLDKSMTPKIANLGLSRVFFASESREAKILKETLGCMPPEYLDHRFISIKFDVFSFGVIIIKMVAGKSGYFRFSEMSPKEFIKLVSEKWMLRLQTMTDLYYLHEIQILQVNTCVEIALRCVNKDPEKRPRILDIVKELDELDAEINKMLRHSHGSKDLILQIRSKSHHIPFHELVSITNNFSSDGIIGEGGFGVVYKGVLQNGQIIAIKKLLQSTPRSKEQFENELNLLMKLEHPNIVRLVGHCYERKVSYMHHDGRLVPAWSTETFICLEYMPNGSLKNCISDASSGLNWHTRFKIIEGICYGIKYLHEQFTDSIIHLDLKPANILLDENFLPKITDFGLSRLFDQNQTIRTANSTGTLGYMSQEYQLRGIITPMADIFSLGAIILEVVTGHRDYPYPEDIRKSSEGFINLELHKWRNKLQEEPLYTSLEADSQQIRRCIQIGLICVNRERTRRPTVKKIINLLQGSENISWYITNELSSHDVQAEQ